MAKMIVKQGQISQRRRPPKSAAASRMGISRTKAPAQVVIPSAARARTGSRRVLSFAVFQLDRSDTRATGLYHRALPAVLRACATIAPSWTVFLHHDDSLLEHPYGKVVVAAAEAGLLELRPQPKPTELCKAMLWRLKPAWEDNVEIVACRDLDSLFLPRDRIALEAFAASDAWAHALLDNVAHAGLMGGMSAYRVRDLRRLFPMSYEEFLKLDQTSHEEWKQHGTDQNFLNRVVGEKLSEHLLTHQLASKSLSELPFGQISDVSQDTMTAADVLAPYCGAAGFDVEHAVAFYDTEPATYELRALEEEQIRRTLQAASSEVYEAIETKYAKACADPSDINEHLPMLRSYAGKCNHVTEMGVRDVVSSWAFLAAQPKRMISYDISRSEKVSELESLALAACEHGFEFRQQSTLDAEIEETDLLFIDTLHTYIQLSAELLRHAPRVRKWIAMHDTSSFGDAGEDGSSPGLLKAIEDLLAKGGWRICQQRPHNNGLTILERVT